MDLSDSGSPARRKKGSGSVPEILDIRQFDARDFMPLLEMESRVWRERLRWDFSATARMVSTCLREKRLSGYALVTKGRIQGYCFFFYDGEKGLIGDLFLQPENDSLDPVFRLLAYVVDAMVATPGLLRIETQLPHFTFDELDPWFRTRCFEGFRRLFMVVSLSHQPEGYRPPLSKDFSVEPWERKHDREAAELLRSTYQNHVDGMANDQYRSLPGTLRLVENIMQHRGCGDPLPASSLVTIHRPTQKLAGILAVTAVGPHTAHIPQIGVAKEFQAVGLGTAMMEVSFARLAGQGYREVSLTVTELNAGAVRLYQRLGFETFRTFGAFVWNRPS